MGVQKRNAKLGFAKQSVKGTAIAAPEYMLGLVSGSVYHAEIAEDNLNTTWSNRVNQGFDRTSVVPGAEGEHVGLPKSIGALLMAVMGTLATTGSSAPYMHTYSPSNSLPWYTLFGNYGASKVAITDAKADSLSITWDKSGAIKVKVKWMGITLTFDSTYVETSTVEEQVAAGPFRGAGGAFSVFGSNLRVTGGTITIENALEAITQSAGVVPDDIFEAAIKATVSLKVVPDDLNEFRRQYTGTTSGTAVSGSPSMGAVSCQFKSGTDTLTFAAPSCRFVAAMPDADAGGGAAEITLEGEVADPATGADAFSFVLVNEVPTY